MSTKWCIQNCVIYFGNRKIYCRITKIPKHYTFDRSFSSASSNTTVITQTLHILWNEAVECGWMYYSRRFSWSSIWRPPALILLRVESVTGISGVLTVFCVKYLIDCPFFDSLISDYYLISICIEKDFRRAKEEFYIVIKLRQKILYILLLIVLLTVFRQFMDKNYDVINFIWRRPRVAIFAENIKIANMFIKTTFKN